MAPDGGAVTAAARKSPERVAEEAKRLATEAKTLAVHALDRANEAEAVAAKNRTSIEALERRLDDGHVSIMKELATVRELLNDIVKLLVHRASTKAPT